MFAISSTIVHTIFKQTENYHIYNEWTQTMGKVILQKQRSEAEKYVHARIFPPSWFVVVVRPKSRCKVEVSQAKKVCVFFY